MSAAWSQYLRELRHHRPELELTPGARSLLEVLGHYDGPTGCHPSTAELAARLAVTARTVRRNRAELRRLGVLTIIAGDGRGNVSYYYLPTLEHPRGKGDTGDLLSVGERGTPATSFRSRKGDTQRAQRRTHVSSGRSIEDPPTRAPVDNTVAIAPPPPAAIDFAHTVLEAVRRRAYDEISDPTGELELTSAPCLRCAGRGFVLVQGWGGFRKEPCPECSPCST